MSLFGRLFGIGRRRAARPAVESGVLDVAGIEVEVLRKRVRNLTLRVAAPDGRVRISVPRATSEASIRSMVLERLGWIERQRARLAALPPPPPPLTEADRAGLLEAIPPLIAKWEAALGVRVAAWNVKRMRSRWGSCNPATGRVSIALELARHPPECLDYLVLHELAHLLDSGHGARFKAILDRHMPQWRERRAALKRRPPAPPPAASGSGA